MVPDHSSTWLCPYPRDGCDFWLEPLQNMKDQLELQRAELADKLAASERQDSQDQPSSTR